VKIILLESIPNVGKLGELVDVKGGFARNWLLPQGKALPATPANCARVESERRALEEKAQERRRIAEQRAAQFEGLHITISAQASEEGRLFGSVGTQEIIRALAVVGHTVVKNEIYLAHGPIRILGDHEIELHFQAGQVISKMRVSIVTG